MFRNLEAFKLYLSKGCSISKEDISFLFGLKNTSLCSPVIKAINTNGKRSFTEEEVGIAISRNNWDCVKLMISKENLKSSLFQAVLIKAPLKHLHLIALRDHFLSLKYRPTRTDVQYLLKNREWRGEDLDLMQVISFFRPLLQEAYLYVDSEDIQWAVSHDSYSGIDYEKLCLKILEELLTMKKSLTPSDFQCALKSYFSPKVVELFLKQGYQITSLDFEYVVKRLNEHSAKNGNNFLREVNYSDPNPDVLTQLISTKAFKSTVGAIGMMHQGAGYQLSKDNFLHLIATSHLGAVRDAIKYGYVVGSEDFKKVIDATLDAPELFKYGYIEHNDKQEFGYEDAGYLPNAKDVQYALANGILPSFLSSTIKRGYKVTGDDVVFALENKCPLDTLNILLHHGYIIPKGYEDNSYWSKVPRFMEEKAGFSPTLKEFQVALKKELFSIATLRSLLERNPACADYKSLIDTECSVDAFSLLAEFRILPDASTIAYAQEKKCSDTILSYLKLKSSK